MNKKSIKYKNPGSSSITRFERIHTEIFDDKKNAEFLIAKEIKKLIEKNNKKNKTTVLGLATGSSPLGVYKSLIDFHKNEKLSFKNVVTFNLDEYYGLIKDHKQSYHHFMNENLFNHIDIKRTNINIPDGFLDKKNIDKYCKEYEKKIESFGGIDIQILGIGANGHIGFNEPGSNLNSITRLVKLDYQTRNDARLNFNGIKNVPTSAITMGIKTILNSKRIILIAWGQGKSEAIRRAVELRKNIKIPALNSIGYQEIIRYIKGGLSKDKLIESVIIKTRQYAKKQMKWFKKEDIDLLVDLTNLNEIDFHKYICDIYKIF